MKKQFHVLFLLLVAASYTCANDATGKTFFSVRPPFQSEMPEKVSMFRDRAWAKECGWGGAFQAVVFGGRSTKPKDLARYFMYGGKSELVALSTGINDFVRDINPFNFNIRGGTGFSYTSTISFRPRQTYAGLGLDYVQYFGCDCKKWWIEASAPILWVRNDMRLTETRTVTGTPFTGTNASLVDAFAGGAGFQPTGTGAVLLNFGKIKGSRKKVGLADIEFKVGYQFHNDECYHAEGYVGILIPTGNKPKGEYVFEPIIGHNHHWGVMFGGSFGYELWHGCGDSSLRLECAANGRYLFRNTQTRSFDLKYRPWSRYLLAYPDATAAALGLPTATTAGGVVNAINLFTRKVHVKPRFSADFNKALVYRTGCGFQGEVGYNFWARQGEKVTLRDPWVVGPAIADLTSSADINRLSNIGNDNPGADVLYTLANAIQPQDLDLDSAAHPACISHIVYGSLGYAWDEMCTPIFVGVGGSYEFSSLNTALHRWMVWGKVGVSF